MHAQRDFANGLATRLEDLQNELQPPGSAWRSAFHSYSNAPFRSAFSYAPYTDRHYHPLLSKHCLRFAENARYRTVHIAL